jgi:hypothetical protein
MWVFPKTRDISWAQNIPEVITTTRPQMPKDLVVSNSKHRLRFFLLQGVVSVAYFTRTFNIRTLIKNLFCFLRGPGAAAQGGL